MTLHRGFYAIVDLGSLGAREPARVAAELLTGGCVALQLRGKGVEPRALLPIARELATLARSHGTPFIVNDHVDVARECRADGVHLGQQDAPVDRARRALGAGALLGLSTHTLEQAREAAGLGVDYLGFGPVMPTRTKPDADPVQGLRALKDVCRAVDLPVVAIGGLTLAHAAAVRDAGATAIAAIGAVLHAERVDVAARRFHQALGG